MTLQQLEYIVAVDQQRHFARAAEQCFVTQATLSMMVKKLEEELGTVLFDRSRQPVVPTHTGESIIAQARRVLYEAARLKQLAAETETELSGTLRVGIIPTLAPYLLPLFLQPFLNAYPRVKLKITEQNTGEILHGLSREKLDVGLMATPLPEEGFNQRVLFYEPFHVYTSRHERLIRKKYLQPEDIDLNRLWLLEEGHCMRSQILNLCTLQKEHSAHANLEYEAGSIESLLQIVEMNEGLTIIPELAVRSLPPKKRKQLHPFKAPVPVREISLVTYRYFVKHALLNALQEQVVKAVSKYIPLAAKDKRVLEISPALA